jgi:Fusaric acid resistance protein-like
MAGQAVAPSLPAEKTGIWNDVASMNWSEFRPIEALACVPAIISLITFGLALGDMTAALAASSGALVVGFGAFQQDFRHPAEPMLLVSVGMSLSAGIGTLAHASLPLDLTCVALWGFGLGLMNIVGRGPGWLALQGSTALVIAAAFPATPVYAAWRFILVLAGGAVQLAIVLAIRWLAPGHLFAPATNASFTVRSILSQIRDMIASRAPGLGHAIAMALAVSAANLLYRMLDMPNGYWVPMTVLLILRPAARETAARALARLAGTLCGAGLLTLLMAFLRPPVPVLVGLIAATAWTCYAFLRVNYAIQSLAITMYVVLLFAIAGLPEPLVALHRAVATLLGGVIALLAHLVGIAAMRFRRRHDTV